MLWTLNLRQIRAAAATARLGRVSAAAQAISISQPAITQGIARIEAQLATPLFIRNPAGMVPTPAMALLAPRIEAALRHIASPRVTMAQVRALIALADAGSYPGASVATGLAQPTLHRAIADLATALRRPLVERRGRGIGFTDAGVRVVRNFRLARGELLAGLSEVASLNGHETGRIAVGAMPLARARLLPAAVTAFHRSHPDARITIAEGAFAELIEPLRDGEIDLMLGALRDPSPGADLIQTPLFEDRPLVIARAGHPLAAAAPDVETLARYQWILPPPGTPLRTLWQHLFDGQAIAPPPVPIECGSVITIRQLLLDSDFLTLLSPDQVAVELEAGWLTVIAAAPPDLARTIGMTVRADWCPTAMQAKFVKILKETALAPG